MGSQVCFECTDLTWIVDLGSGGFKIKDLGIFGTILIYNLSTKHAHKDRRRQLQNTITAWAPNCALGAQI